MELNGTEIIVALIAAVFTGGFGREVVAGLKKMARGVAAKESARGEDLVAARIAADQRAHLRYENELTLRDYAARLRRQLLDAGMEPVVDEPELHDTITI